MTSFRAMQKERMSVSALKSAEKIKRKTKDAMTITTMKMIMNNYKGLSLFDLAPFLVWEGF